MALRHTLAALLMLRATALVPSRAAAPPRTTGLRAATTEPATTEPATDKVITITPDALEHIAKLRDAEGPGTHLRMGVKAGGCSGMSYAMDLCNEKDITQEDHVEEWEGGFKVVIDPKSMLYLFGLELGYSNELIGGGFQFQNPNAETSCGCGTSFGI
mmetsp:Transcript_2366/g.6976  ORF Transcript_2366/g.6976 Transcript_2366/m.6976 type:complete len:158 (-) Transcript_2366:47-520(-)